MKGLSANTMATNEALNCLTILRRFLFEEVYVIHHPLLSLAARFATV